MLLLEKKRGGESYKTFKLQLSCLCVPIMTYIGVQKWSGFKKALGKFSHFIYLCIVFTASVEMALIKDFHWLRKMSTKQYTSDCWNGKGANTFS